MKKYTKLDQINDLITALNELRGREGKKPVKRFWTGLAHRIHTIEEPTTWIGTHYFKDGEFIAFLEGLLIDKSL